MYDFMPKLREIGEASKINGSFEADSFMLTHALYTRGRYNMLVGGGGMQRKPRMPMYSGFEIKR
jgi:hypothetical protein